MSTTLRRPINKVGPATKRWARWEAKCVRDVLARNMRLRFGLCDITDCKNKYHDRAHLFGRAATGARLGEPWCSLPELCLALCRDHHNMIDRGLGGDLLKELRWAAISRLVDKFPDLVADGYHPLTYSDPTDAARRAVGELEKSREFDADLLTFTKKEA